MKNSLADLNNHLFETIERLNDESLTNEEIEKEVERSAAIVSVAKQIVENGRLQFDVLKMQTDYERHVDKANMPELLRIEKRT